MKQWIKWTALIASSALAHGARGQVETKPAKLSFEIGKETTVLTSPLLPNGMPDYVRALNEKYGRGVTPENNALLPLLKIRGVDASIDETVRAKFLEMAGAPADKPGAKVFVPFEAYAKEKGWKEDAEKADDLLAEITRDPWRKPVNAHVAEYVAAQAQFFDLGTEASKKRDFYTPFVSLDETLNGVELYKLAGIVPFGRAWIARGALRAAEGDMKGAIEDVAATKRMSRLFMKPGSLICALEGYVFDGLGYSLTETLIRSEKLKPSECDDLAKALNVPPLESAAPYLDTLERWLFLAALQTHAQGTFDALLAAETDPKRVALFKSIDVPSVDWNVAMKELNRWRDTQVAVASARTFAEFAQGHKDLTAVSDGWKMEIESHDQLLGPLPRESREDYSKRIVHGLLVKPPAFDLLKYEETRRTRDLIQTMQVTILLAVKSKAERGSAPKTAKELVPGILKELPVDPYSPKGDKLLYFVVEGRPAIGSVGPDGIAGTADDLITGG